MFIFEGNAFDTVFSVKFQVVSVSAAQVYLDGEKFGILEASDFWKLLVNVMRMTEQKN